METYLDYLKNGIAYNTKLRQMGFIGGYLRWLILQDRLKENDFFGDTFKKVFNVRKNNLGLDWSKQSQINQHRVQVLACDT